MEIRKVVLLDEMISRLQTLKEQHGNLPVIVDFDEDGYYDAEGVEVVEDDGVKFANISLVPN